MGGVRSCVGTCSPKPQTLSLSRFDHISRTAACHSRNPLVGIVMGILILRPLRAGCLHIRGRHYVFSGFNGRCSSWQGNLTFSQHLPCMTRRCPRTTALCPMLRSQISSSERCPKGLRRYIVHVLGPKRFSQSCYGKGRKCILDIYMDLPRLRILSCART